MYRHHNFGNKRRLNFKAIACIMIAIGIIGLGISLTTRSAQKNGLQNTVTEEIVIPQIAGTNTPIENNTPAPEETSTGDIANPAPSTQNTASTVEPITPINQPAPVNAPEGGAAGNVTNGTTDVGTPQTTKAAPPAILEMPTHDYAGVRINGGAIEIKFATGKTDVADSTRAMLINTARAGARNKYVVITTFGNPKQDPKTNERLARERGLKIKQLLVELGTPTKQVIILKPQPTPIAGVQNTFPQVVVVKVEDKVNYPLEMILTDTSASATK